MFMHILQEAWLPYWLCWLVMFLPDNKMLHSVVFYISRLNHSRIAICWFGNVKRAKQESVEQHCKSGQMEKKTHLNDPDIYKPNRLSWEKPVSENHFPLVQNWNCSMLDKAHKCFNFLWWDSKNLHKPKHPLSSVLDRSVLQEIKW